MHLEQYLHGARRRRRPSPLRIARWYAGLTQSELALTVGCSRRTIFALEAGRSIPSLGLALALARRLDLSVEELFPLAELR